MSHKQHTLTWHVDDVKSTHVNHKLNDEFAIWCEEKYELRSRVKRHDYIEITLDYSKKKTV